MLGTIIWFHESFTNIVTITFSSLIIIELLNVYSEVTIPKFNLTSIDKQTQLENDCIISGDICALHSQYFSVEKLL